MRTKYGLKGSALRTVLTVSQGFIFMVWAGLVQRFSFTIEDYPEMLTGGFLWFKDLSMTDPYLLIPILNAIVLTFSTYVKI